MGGIMDGKARGSIEAILETYGNHQRAVRQEMERRRVEREAFLLEFQDKVRVVVKPVMEQVGEMLVRSGHEFEIFERGAAAPVGRAVTAVVTLAIFPEGERPRTEEPAGWPHLALLAHPTRNRVLVHESAMMPGYGGPAGTAAEYSLDAITPEVVEKHIVSVLSRAMGVGRSRKNKKASRRHLGNLNLPAEVPRTATETDRIEAAFDYLATLGAPKFEDKPDQ